MAITNELKRVLLKLEEGEALSWGEQVIYCTGMLGYSREEAQKIVEREGQQPPSYLRSTDYEKNSADHRCNFGLR